VNFLRFSKLRKLPNLAGIDEELFANRKLSKELDNQRKEWTAEFDKRTSYQ
jgi:hypothetical protein